MQPRQQYRIEDKSFLFLIKFEGHDKAFIDDSLSRGLLWLISRVVYADARYALEELAKKVPFHIRDGFSTTATLKFYFDKEVGDLYQILSDKIHNKEVINQFYGDEQIRDRLRFIRNNPIDGIDWVLDGKCSFEYRSYKLDRRPFFKSMLGDYGLGGC